ncbi:hypothetical protein OGW18_11860 [Citrobacter sp. CK184]|nr:MULTISPECIES: hypothetical protein [Citrobacter]EKV5611400.1 hypothetical protein [Citrobacter koseri]MCE5350941.1 hypothetical protein [Citrobacter koseri]MDM3028857.1 hypothetical protein [Citrobacter sp. CK185]MDM3047003.1 hypothetical protein [Citrobacter sp. CK184]WEE17968.1 hypothetical protein PX343_03280 [Citrobacter koseri]
MQEPQDFGAHMDKLKIEDSVFQASKRYLHDLYGDFTRIDEQKDKPDAAIRLSQKVDSVDVTIGIEITCVDKQGDLQYFNDEKFSRDITQQQIDDCINGVVPTQPMKKASIAIGKDYFYEAIEKKRDKYDGYKNDGGFDGVIILVFSQLFGCDEKHFSDYHVSWTNYLLSKSDFPFDKVVFVDRAQSKCITMFDKNKPKTSPPKNEPNKELGFTQIHSGYIPMNQSVNMYDIFKMEPLVNKKKSKSKRKKR